MTLLQEKLNQNLNELACSGKRFYLAYSGGMDSHVLLHLCAGNAQLKVKLTAVYINHGLQVEADCWEKHCQKTCQILGVDFLALTVKAAAAKGQSPEEAARDARYQALNSILKDDDVLLLAQHAEDQLETVLLQLFRGSGLKGLSGMPGCAAFGKGHLMRPLLEISKAEIVEYAMAKRLDWVEDPSNGQNNYDRNFLRNTVLPLLKERWPALDKTVGRAAKHCADAQVIIDELSDSLLESVITEDNALDLSRLQKKSLSHQKLVIRHWFRHLKLKMPSQDLVLRILQEVLEAKEGANPVLNTQSCEIRRYQNVLYCLKPKYTDLNSLSWPPGKQRLTLANGEIYCLESATNGISKKHWENSDITVCFRTGGERICLPGRSGTHRLKKLLQEAGVPPWERDFIPLIYMNSQLAAVGEYWIASAFYSELQTDCVRIVRRKGA